MGWSIGFAKSLTKLLISLISNIETTAKQPENISAPMSHIRQTIKGSAGYITLDRPKALNSLTHDMIADFHKALMSHESDNNVDVIVVRSSNERAFCAGGDMKSTRLLALDEKWQELQLFFEQEYALNLHIAQCSKPYISLVNGIAMGGGLGLSVHGNLMVVSETTRLAMPETAIGFFPDVGGSYFLSGLAYDAGQWLSLSGIPTTGIEAVTVGLATHYVHSSHWNTLSTAIEQTGTDALDDVLKKLTESSHDPDFNQTEFKQRLEHRRHWFSASTHEELLRRLQTASESPVETTVSQDAADLLKRIQKMSPHAMNITRQLLKDAKGQDLSACLQLELQAAAKAVRHPDFVEGIRAVLVDKDSATWSDT